jgi:hypothetical protein
MVRLEAGKCAGIPASVIHSARSVLVSVAQPLTQLCVGQGPVAADMDGLGLAQRLEDQGTRGVAAVAGDQAVGIFWT